jgi:hypothetical protein
LGGIEPILAHRGHAIAACPAPGDKKNRLA